MIKRERNRELDFNCIEFHFQTFFSKIAYFFWHPPSKVDLLFTSYNKFTVGIVRGKNGRVNEETKISTRKQIPSDVSCLRLCSSRTFHADRFWLCSNPTPGKTNWAPNALTVVYFKY